MKTLIIPLIALFAICAKAAEPAALPPFAAWETAQSQEPTAAELQAADVHELLGNPSTTYVVALAGEEKVLITAMIHLSPAGLKFRADRGILFVKFEELSDVADLKTLTGWTASIARRYRQLKGMAVQQGNAAVAKAAMDSELEKNRVTAKQERENPPLVPIPSVNSLNRPATRVGGVASTSSTKRITQAPGESSEPKLVAPPPVAAIIKAHALKQWPKEYSMQEYEIKVQTKAWFQLQTYKTAGIPGVPAGVLSDLIAEGEKKWKDEYDMVIYHIEEEAKSYLKVR